MAEARNMIEQGKAMWTGMPAARRMLIVSAAVVTLAGALFLAARGSVEPYDTLYAGLAADAVIIGAFDRIEIWDSTRWQDISSEADESLNAAVTGLGI